MPIFRKGTEKDIKRIAELESKTFSDAWTERSVMETFEQKQAFITVAEVDGRFAGYCIIYYVMDEAEIARIAITEECCKKRRIERLLLDVRESNEGAIAFYEKYGFRADGIRKNFYDLPRENAVLMSKSVV